MSKSQMRGRNIAGSVVMIVAAMSLTGCSALASLGLPSRLPSSEATEMAAAPATGAVVMGSGYSYALPAPWTEKEDALPPNIDSVAVNLTDADGFTDSVNVSFSPLKWATPEIFEFLVVDELEHAGATDVRTRTRLTIGGAASAHFSAVMTVQGLEYLVEQYYVCTAGQTYIVTFSFSPTVPEPDRDALAEAIFATWLWD